MSCSVNLIPQSRLHARQRAHRTVRAAIVTATMVVLLGIGLATRFVAENALSRLAHETKARQVEREEVQQRLADADAERVRVINRLRTVAAARRPQPWPGRFVALAQSAPDGVFLTTIEITTPDDGASRQRRRAASRRESQPAPDRQPTNNGAQVVRLRGYALDHGALLQLVNALQQLPGWTQVELKRGTLQPLSGRMVVDFEIDCQTQEATS